MFAKAQKVSGSSLLKNKDAKKLKKDVVARFKDTCTEEDLQQVITSKTVVKKISFQAPSRMVVYALEETKEPLLFDISGKGDMVFSVYALWRLPHLLPKLVVHAPVSEFVLRGADVMLPGVVFTSTEELASLKKGELRCVVAWGNPHAFAVGELLVDAVDIERSGKKGKALRLMHCVGDELWQMGPQTLPNEGFLEGRIVPINSSGETQEHDDNDEVDDEELKQEAELQRDGTEDDVDGEMKVASISLNENCSNDDQSVSESYENEITKDEMDEYFLRALLQALKTGKIKEKQLPMLASTFHSTILLPCRAANTSLNIKQSSYKKLSVFLKQMEKKGLLVVTERDGIQSIAEISRQHPDVLAHAVYWTAEDAKLEESAAEQATGGGPVFVPGQYAPEVKEFLGLSPALKTLFRNEMEHASIFQEAIDNQKKYWSAAEVRDLVMKYVDTKELVDQRDKKFVKLNGPLTDALFGRKTPAGGYPERVSRPELTNQLLSKCTKYHQIKLFPGHNAKIHGGDVRPITIHAEKAKKHANSTITSITSYQQFGIDGEAFAKEAQKKWGCSASTQPSENKKGDEIKIQGQMVNEVLGYLASRYQINTAKFCSVSYGKNVKVSKK